MFLTSQRFLIRTLPDGRRQASWRLWVLIWLLPVAFAVATAVLAAMVYIDRDTMIETTGEVTHVYAWENDAPQIFYPGETIYSPRFRYVWSDGSETEATTGSSHTGWNFALGSKHRIRYDPDEKGDVVLAGPSEWWVTEVIGLMALSLLPVGLVGSALLMRWLNGGKRAAQ